MYIIVIAKYIEYLKYYVFDLCTYIINFISFIFFQMLNVWSLIMRPLFDFVSAEILYLFESLVTL